MNIPKGLLQVKACILHQLQTKIDEHKEKIANNVEQDEYTISWLKDDLSLLESTYQKVINDDWSYDDINYDMFAVKDGVVYTISKTEVEASVPEYKMLTLDLKINDVLK